MNATGAEVAADDAGNKKIEAKTSFRFDPDSEGNISSHRAAKVLQMSLENEKTERKLIFNTTRSHEEVIPDTSFQSLQHSAVEVDEMGNESMDLGSISGEVHLDEDEEEFTYEIDVQLLRDTFEQIKPNGIAFVRQFYATLFEKHTNLHSLFSRIDQSHQEKKLLNILTLIVENIESQDMLASTLQGLGAKHVGFGVIPPYFQHMGEALIEIMRKYFQEIENQTGKQWWTEEAEASWRGAYAMVAGLLLEGYKQTPSISNSTANDSNKENILSRVLSTKLSIPISNSNIESNAARIDSPIPDNTLSPRSSILAEFRRTSRSSSSSIRMSSSHTGSMRFRRQSSSVRISNGNGDKSNDNNTGDIISAEDRSPLSHRERIVRIKEWWQNICQKYQGQFGSAAHSYLLYLYSVFIEAPIWVIVAGTIIIYLLLTRLVPQASWISGLVESIEEVSLMIGVILYMKEAPDRRKQFHYHAWGAIDGASSNKVSQTRIMALQDLNNDGVSLRGFHGEGLDLSEVKLPHADLRQCQLNNVRFDDGDLSGADLSYASLNHASLVKAELKNIRLEFAHREGSNFNGSNLENANLFCADFTHANLSGVNFRNASLKGVCFEHAVLAGADFTGADVDVRVLSKGVLSSTRMPDGTLSP